MRRSFLFGVLGLLLFLPAAVFGYGHYTVFSAVPADVYIDNEYRATISATQTLKLILAGPATYVIGVRAKETGRTHKETVTVGADLNEHREIRAFSNVQPATAEITVYSGIPADVFIDGVFKAAIDSQQPLAVELPGPATYIFEVRAKDSKLIQREEVRVEAGSEMRTEIRAFSEAQAPTVLSPTTSAPVAAPTGEITREEMDAAIAKAASQAKAEALAEEAARRQRAGKRAVTNKGIAHVVGVEANQGLPNSVKNMERIKLLMEALPSFKK